MDINLPRLYREYGKYSNWRNFPYSLDGLKPVERRILFSAFQIAKTKFTKSARIDGHVMGNYHPHGSCYGSITQMVRQGFLEGQGNFGSNIGVDVCGASASRYTEAKLHEKTLNLGFQYINFVPWFVNDLGQKEPEYLSSMFPFCLMGTEYTQGIGFGFKTYIPCYALEDLKKRLEWLLKIRQRKPIIKPITECNILSNNSTLDELLTTGSAKIEFQGVIDIDSRRCVATLKSWPPGRKFETIFKKLPYLDNNAVGYLDQSEGDTTAIEFKVLRERGRDAIFKEFVEKLTDMVTATISFETTVVDKGDVIKVMPIDEMLIQTFNHFKKANEYMLKDQMLDINAMINDYNILDKIRLSLSGCIRSGVSIKDTCAIVERETKVKKEKVEEFLNKYRIKRLLNLSIDLEELGDKLKECEEKLENLHDYTLEQYNKL